MKVRFSPLFGALLLLSLLSVGCMSRPLAYSKAQWASMSDHEKQRAWHLTDLQFAERHAGFEQSVLYLGYPPSLGDWVYSGPREYNP